MNRERLQALANKHRLCRCKLAAIHGEEPHCREDGKLWPCSDSEIIALALEAERLRAVLADAERNLEDAGRWAQQAAIEANKVAAMVAAFAKYRARAGTEAKDA